jgi:protein disulfide-isomerase A6
MKPAWDQLGDDYAGSSSVLIGDVDCTSAGEMLCHEYEVEAYPGIKYFVDGDKKGKDYEQGMDYDSLKKFIEETLEVKCDINNPTWCSDKEKDFIEKMKGRPAEERIKQLRRLDHMKGDSMKSELKQWLRQRLHILRSLEPNEEL